MELKEVNDEQLILSKKYGNSGTAIATPKSEAEIAEILQAAKKDGKKISVMGRGTKRGYGGLKEKYDLALSLVNYKGIVEHTVGDMTVTVRAGTTIAELQDYLRKHDQMVSIDPSWPQQATVGGVIAANESGPKRLKYGSARDLVIGLRVVYPDGRIIRTGGKVVKNVAGYDMNKLFIGSMGTLGVISEITMKLRPTPKYESLVLLSVAEEHVDELKSFIIEIQDSIIEPATLELVNPSLSKKLLDREEFTLLIAFEDVENAVHYQEEWVEEHKPKGAITTCLSVKDANTFWERFSLIQPNSLTDDDHNERVEVVLKIGSKNMDVLDILKEAQRIHYGGNGITIEAHGGLGHGISYFHLIGHEEVIKSSILQMRDFVDTKRGYVTVKHLPFKLRQEINPWGENPSYFFLFEGIKRKIDPENTLNHKRFIGGI
ncbi:FAD-binding oxidoreductase [Alkalihalobacillus sp. AL-G]|nr:FAD-binding oxidoreductase [Alkalihalobacillus sp. AL-G]WLD94446.1 FAD-binding oxidoreductase [Alkalihalobacillus sp. AL-G]